MFPVCSRLTLCRVLLVLLAGVMAPVASAATYAGRPVRAVLQELQRPGLTLIYNDVLVPAGLRVLAEPAATVRHSPAQRDPGAPRPDDAEHGAPARGPSSPQPAATCRRRRCAAARPAARRRPPPWRNRRDREPVQPGATPRRRPRPSSPSRSSAACRSWPTSPCAPCTGCRAPPATACRASPTSGAARRTRPRSCWTACRCRSRST